MPTSAHSREQDRSVRTQSVCGYAHCGAADFFVTLMQLDRHADVRVRYRLLHAVLTQAVEQQIGQVRIHFSGLFSKIDYLLKEHRACRTDSSLARAIHDTRRRLSHLDDTPSDLLQRTLPHDIKAVSKFIATTCALDIPPALARTFPDTPLPPSLSRLRREGEVVEEVRCVVNSWDDTHLRCTREDTGQDATISYTHAGPYELGDWSYLRTMWRKGMVVNLVRPRTEGGVIVPELFILHPDFLVNVTAVAGCFESYGVSSLIDLLNKLRPAPRSEAICLGNFAGQLLDEATYGKHPDYAESVRTFFRRNAIALATTPDLSADFHSNARQQQAHIRQAVGETYRRQVSRSFKSEDNILEPSFFSPTLGLQGRMDFLDLSYRVLIEQKSGKGRFRPGGSGEELGGAQTKHLVQVLLYRALLHYGYRRARYEDLQSFLLYSRYPDGLLAVSSAPALLFDALRVRNEIACRESDAGTQGFGFLERLTPDDVFPTASGKLWELYGRPQLASLLAPLASASSLERAYVLRMLRFVATEHVLSRVGNRVKEDAGFASLWNCSLTDKREAGNIYERLALELPPTPEGTPIEEVFLRFGKEADMDTTNFRTGDIVLLYPYADLPDATQTVVFRATIDRFLPEGIWLRLRNPQSTSAVFAHFRHERWAVEHDFMEASYTALYRGVYALLSTTPERRQLWCGSRALRTDASVTQRGEYGSKEFNDLVLHARQASDLYLIIGPPGTGKTSFGIVNLLHEQLLDPQGGAVLLLSFTNRAVDEICSKLVTMRVDGKPVDFLRIGSSISCAGPYRNHLLERRTDGCRNVEEVKKMLREARVVCGTTTALNAQSALLDLKPFRLAIVDEASQILEPHLVGLLSARHDGADAIEKIVLIGDEKQLPAVVQQLPQESAVSEPELRAIGLTDCALSFFERMLRLYAYRPDGQLDETVCHRLTRQGRMHPAVAQFASETFYEGLLRPVPLPHQQESEARTTHSAHGIDRLLATRRMAFVSYPEEENTENVCGTDKVNLTEARMIAATVARVRMMWEQDFDPAQSVGVIVPYRNQIAAVRQALAPYGLPDLAGITIDTVERYQGSQREVIIYGFTARKHYQLSFLTHNEYVDPHSGSVVDRKLNVAMTRARRRMVLIGHAPLLEYGLTFRRLIDYARRTGCFFSIEAKRYAAGDFEVDAPATSADGECTHAAQPAH